MSQWLSGFISGVAATLVGFLCTILWDIYKYRRDVSERDKSILKVVQHDLEENRHLATENRAMLKQELEILDKRKELVPPLLLMKTGLWDLLKANLPKKLVKNTDLLERIQALSLLASHINEEIRSRQNYKNASSMMSNYNETIKIHDGILISDLDRLTKGLDERLQSFRQPNNESNGPGSICYELPQRPGIF
jgi:hypothetical protein